MYFTISQSQRESVHAFEFNCLFRRLKAEKIKGETEQKSCGQCSNVLIVVEKRFFVLILSNEEILATKDSSDIAYNNCLLQLKFSEILW